MTTNSRRPIGITLVSLVLFWLFIAAVGNLFVWKSVGSANFPPASPAATFANAMNSSSFVLLVSFYGVTALVAAVGTWLMRSWMPLAFLAWSIAAMLLGGFFLFVIPAEILLGGKPAAVAFIVGMGLLLWLVYRYVHRVASAAPQAAL
jgi:hypothetical protein